MQGKGKRGPYQRDKWTLLFVQINKCARVLRLLYECVRRKKLPISETKVETFLAYVLKTQTLYKRIVKY